MPIQPLQLPRILDLPKIDFSGLDKIGDAIGEYRQRSALADSLPGVLGTQVSQQGPTPQGNGLNTLGQPQQQSQAQPQQATSFAPEVSAAIDTASARHGVPKEYLTRTASLESGGRTDATNPNSSAGGLFQFTNGTAKQYGLDNKNDANSSADAAARLALDNKRALSSRLGREPNDGELYLAHQQGAGGASALLANPNANVIEALTPAYGGDRAKATAAVVNNGGDPRMTAGQFASIWTGKFSGQQQQAQAPQQPGPSGAAPGAVQPNAGGMPPQQVERLQAMIRAGGQSEKMALALIQKYVEPKFGFQVVGDKLYRTNTTAGTAEAIEHTNKPEFKVIGKDQNGYDIHGFVDPHSRRVWDLQGKPIDPAKLMGSGQQANANTTGEDYLKTLDPGRASQVKAIVEGRMAPPSSMALRSPQMVALIRDAAQYEPGFDMTKWTQRNSTVRDFASGKGAQNVTSLNTVIGHLGDLAEKADALGNYRIPLANTVTNAVSNATGDPRINNFRLARNAVADEMAKVFRSSGMSDHEIQQWKSTISEDMSPEQLRGAVKTGIGLLESRLSALSDQRNRGFSTALDAKDLLNDKSKAMLEKVMTWANGSTEKPPENKPDAPKTAPAKVQSYDDVNTSLSNARQAVKSGKWKREDAVKRLIDGGVPPEMANKI